MDDIKIPGKIENGFNVSVYLKGLALSIIDNQPKELIYARADSFCLEYSQAIQKV